MVAIGLSVFHGKNYCHTLGNGLIRLCNFAVLGFCVSGTDCASRNHCRFSRTQHEGLKRSVVVSVPMGVGKSFVRSGPMTCTVLWKHYLVGT
jgi:hypothetical protein